MYFVCLLTFHINKELTKKKIFHVRRVRVVKAKINYHTRLIFVTWFVFTLKNRVLAVSKASNKSKKFTTCKDKAKYQVSFYFFVLVSLLVLYNICYLLNNTCYLQKYFLEHRNKLEEQNGGTLSFIWYFNILNAYFHFFLFLWKFMWFLDVKNLEYVSFLYNQETITWFSK